MVDVIKPFILPTLWNRSVNVLYREGRSDLDTFISCIQQDEYKLQTHRMGPGMVGIDLGAHIGAATLAMCSLGMRVIAVEVLSENVQMLYRNLGANSFSADVYHRSISSESDHVEVAYKTAPTDQTGYIHEFIGTTIPHVQLSSLAQDGDSSVVRTIGIHDLFELHQIDRCHFLKVDCEGAEWATLNIRNEEDLKTFNKIDIISGELHSITPGKEVTHGDLLPQLGGLFKDVTEQYEPVYCKPGMQTHFVYKHKSLI